MSDKNIKTGMLIIIILIVSLIVYKSCTSDKIITSVDKTKELKEIRILKDSIDKIITKLDSNSKLIDKYQDKIKYLDKLNTINVTNYENKIKFLLGNSVSNDSVSRYISSKIKNWK